MNVRRFSPETQRNQVRDVGRFRTFLRCAPDTATADDVHRFQIERRDAGVPTPTMNSIVSALRFFFTNTIDRPGLGEPTPALQLDLPSHLQKTISRKIEQVRRAYRIAIEEREQHPPPWRQTWRPGAPHHLIVGSKIDGFMKIDQATLLLGAGKRR
jgi:hypothetical protein